jgi:gluconate kinase
MHIAYIVLRPFGYNLNAASANLDYGQPLQSHYRQPLQLNYHQHLHSRTMFSIYTVALCSALTQSHYRQPLHSRTIVRTYTVTLSSALTVALTLALILLHYVQH